MKDEISERATWDAVEAYVGRYRTEYGDKCKLSVHNPFTIQFLMAHLIEILISNSGNNLKSVHAHIETALCQAEVAVYGEVRH